MHSTLLKGRYTSNLFLSVFIIPFFEALVTNNEAMLSPVLGNVVKNERMSEQENIKAAIGLQS